MVVYAIGSVLSVKDPEGFAAYQQQAGPTVVQYGGKIIGGGTNIQVADGNWSPVGMVILEFESLEQANKWYNSPEYNAVKHQRFETADTGLVFLDGG